MYFHLEVPTNIYNIIIIFKIPLHKDLTIHIICCGEERVWYVLDYKTKISSAPQKFVNKRYESTLFISKKIYITLSLERGPG